MVSGSLDEATSCPPTVAWSRRAGALIWAIESPLRSHTLPLSDRTKMLVTFDRGDYWQCAYVIAKGQYDAVKARGLDAFRSDVAGMAPVLGAGLSDVKTWDDVKLLTVAINRLTRGGPA